MSSGEAESCNDGGDYSHALTTLTALVQLCYARFLEPTSPEDGTEMRDDSLSPEFREAIRSVQRLESPLVAGLLQEKRSEPLVSSLLCLVLQCPNVPIRSFLKDALLPSMLRWLPRLRSILSLGVDATGINAIDGRATPPVIVSIRQLVTVDPNSSIASISPNESFVSPLYRGVLTDPASYTAKQKEKFQRLFGAGGEFCNYYRLMGEFPELLAAHHETIQHLLFATGPLDPAVRLLVAMMGAAQHDCVYFFRRFAVMYLSLEVSSDLYAPREWVTNKESLPPKIVALKEISALMAHRPWLLSVDEVNRCVSNSEATWGTDELLHACAILATVHTLAGFVEVNAVRWDWNTIALPEDLAPLPPNSLSSGETNNGSKTANSPPQYLPGHFADTTTVRYVQRIQKSHSSGGGLNIAQYNWDDHGSMLFERYYEGIAPLISAETELCEGLCDTVGSDIDPCVVTLEGAATITMWWWNLRLYVMNIYGVVFDEYKEETVNNVLHREVKQYVHRVTCIPEEATVTDVVWSQCALVSERHRLLIGLVVMEARRMAALIRTCNAIQAFLGNS